jgi:hypothetical protein
VRLRGNPVPVAAENICLIGPAGTGESHLLVALGCADTRVGAAPGCQASDGQCSMSQRTPMRISS